MPRLLRLYDSRTPFPAYPTDVPINVAPGRARTVPTRHAYDTHYWVWLASKRCACRCLASIAAHSTFIQPMLELRVLPLVLPALGSENVDLRSESLVLMARLLEPPKEFVSPQASPSAPPPDIPWGASSRRSSRKGDEDVVGVQMVDLKRSTPKPGEKGETVPMADFQSGKFLFGGEGGKGETPPAPPEPLTLDPVWVKLCEEVVSCGIAAAVLRMPLPPVEDVLGRAHLTMLLRHLATPPSTRGEVVALGAIPTLVSLGLAVRVSDVMFVERPSSKKHRTAVTDGDLVPAFDGVSASAGEAPPKFTGPPHTLSAQSASKGGGDGDDPPTPIALAEDEEHEWTPVDKPVMGEGEGDVNPAPHPFGVLVSTIRSISEGFESLRASKASPTPAVAVTSNTNVRGVHMCPSLSSSVL